MEELYFNMMTFDKSTFIHAGACFIITLVVSIAMYFIFNISMLAAATAGFISAFLCGIGKEYADYKNPNNFWNWGDIIGNVAGCIIAFVPLILIF